MAVIGCFSRHRPAISLGALPVSGALAGTGPPAFFRRKELAMFEEERELPYTRADKSLDRYNALYISMHRNSASFALLGVRSAFVLNGAALFAFPPIFLALSQNGNSPAEQLTWPAAAFVVGILFAGLCALTAFINFQLFAESTKYDEQLDLIDLTEIHHPKKYEELKTHYTNYRDKYQPVSDRIHKWTTRTARISLVFAILSMISFMVGCYLSGDVLAQITSPKQT